MIFKVAARRGSERLAEHGDERAWRAVAGFQGGVRDLLSRGQQLQRPHQAKLLAPFTKRQVRFLLEQALDRALAGSGPLTGLLQRIRITRIALQSLSHAALEAGYSTPSAFIAMFRKALGTTPRRYFENSRTR